VTENKCGVNQKEGGGVKLNYQIGLSITLFFPPTTIKKSSIYKIFDTLELFHIFSRETNIFP